MTTTARLVLQDCKFAITRHTDNLQGEAFRVSWLSIVTLLRAVGHVLDKVDAQRSTAMERAIKEKWKELQSSRPEPPIFWDFIEGARNRFLKNYEHGISRWMMFPSVDGNFKIIFDMANSSGMLGASSVEARGSRLVSTQFVGKNEKQVAWMAHDWWKTYLDEVDYLADQYKNLAHVQSMCTRWPSDQTSHALGRDTWVVESEFANSHVAC